MYFNTALEGRLAVLLRRRNFAWPVMRIGIVDGPLEKGAPGSTPRRTLYGMLRFYVTRGVTRAVICREAKDGAIVAFRFLPSLVQLDIDASEMDDTRVAKATPWFAASIHRQTFESTPLPLPPEQWLTQQSLVTYGSRLFEDPAPESTIVEGLRSLCEEGFQRMPIQRIPKPPH